MSTSHSPTSYFILKTLFFPFYFLTCLPTFSVYKTAVRGSLVVDDVLKATKLDHLLNFSEDYFYFLTVTSAVCLIFHCTDELVLNHFSNMCTIQKSVLTTAVYGKFTMQIRHR